MLKYSCFTCDYTTDDKSNYNKHIKSKTHCKKAYDDVTPKDKHVPTPVVKKIEKRNNGNTNEIELLKALVVDYKNLNEKLLGIVCNDKQIDR